MQVLSLFDGISCGQLALQRAGFRPSIYYASEIDANAITVTQKNFPNTIQLGNVRTVADMVRSNLIRTGGVDVLLAGSPCQGFSKAGVGKGFNDERSKLIFTFMNIKTMLKPQFWLLENLKMEKRDCDFISALLNREPVEINSNLFSAQNRNRLYWTNIPVSPIVDRKVLFPFVREYNGDHLRNYKLNRTPSRIKMWSDGKGTGNKQSCLNVTNALKTSCLTTKQDRWNNAGLIEFEDFCRYLTHAECERLQTLPDHYTAGISDFERYRTLGNCWTVDLIAHILGGMS